MPTKIVFWHDTQYCLIISHIDMLTFGLYIFVHDKCITKSYGGKERPTYNTTKESWLDWSHLAWKLAFKTQCQRKDRREARTGKNSSHWMTLRKSQDSGNWKRMYYIALSGKLAVEGAVHLSLDSVVVMRTNGSTTNKQQHTVLKSNRKHTCSIIGLNAAM